MATAPVKTANDWLKVLSAGKVPDEVPPGYKTSDKIAEETNRSSSHTRRLLRAAVKNGFAEEKSFLIDVGTRLYPVPHFRICNSPKPSA
jgi:hypothetical protein